MQGPLAGTVLVLELTHHFDALMVPTLVAVVEATVLSRKLRASSIYSARLASGAVLQTSPSANAASVATIYALDEALPDDFTRQADGRRFGRGLTARSIASGATSCPASHCSTVDRLTQAGASRRARREVPPGLSGH